MHEENADENAERAYARLSFDPSPEGQALRNHLLKCTNALFRGMANYRQRQAKTSGGRGGATGVGQQRPEPARWEEPGRAVPERGVSQPPVDDSFRWEERPDERLERADVVDTEAVETHVDEVSGLVEIGENATNEANFDEAMPIVESQESVELTANLGVLSALDKVVDQPGDETAQEPVRMEASASESGDPEPETPESSARAGGASVPARFSERANSQSGREEERPAAERMVEDPLKAGCTSLSETLANALALPP